MSHHHHSDVPLHLLRSGECGTVSLIAGSPESVHRLEEIGFRHGARIEVVRPGSPCIVRIDGGHRLCLRDSTLASVLIRTAEPRAAMSVLASPAPAVVPAS